MPLWTAKLIEMEVPKRVKVVTAERSLKRLARTLVKVLSMGRAILVPENMNILLEDISNVFASERRSLPMSKKLTTKDMQFLARKKKDLVTTLKKSVLVKE